MAEKFISDMTAIQEGFIKSTQKALEKHGWKQDEKGNYKHPDHEGHIELHHNGGIYHAKEKGEPHYVMGHKVREYLKGMK
jgi:hypothetical protein